MGRMKETYGGDEGRSYIQPEVDLENMSVPDLRERAKKGDAKADVMLRQKKLAEMREGAEEGNTNIPAPKGTFWENDNRNAA